MFFPLFILLTMILFFFESAIESDTFKLQFAFVVIRDVFQIQSVSNDYFRFQRNNN